MGREVGQVIIAKHEVQKALRGVLRGIAAIPGETQTQWENMPFTATVGVPWKRENLALMDSFRASHGDGLNRDDYSYMLDLYYPAGRDVPDPSTAQQALLSDGGLWIGRTVQVRDTWYLSVDGLRVGKAQEDLPNWYFLPVAIRLFVFGPPK